MAENRAVQQQRIIAKALEGHILEKVLTHTSKHEEQLKAHLTTDNQGESTQKNPDILEEHCQTQPLSDSDNAKSEKKSEKHEKDHRSLGEQNDVRFKREMKQLLEIDINSDKFEKDDSNIPSFQKDTITSFTSRVIANNMVRKAYDERHRDVIFKPCRIPAAREYIDPGEHY